MNPVRPSPFSPIDRPVAPARDDAAKLAAQRAFFQAAMGIAPAPATATPSAPAYAAPVRAERTPDPAMPAPQKILRPGSLLDIRV